MNKLTSVEKILHLCARNYLPEGVHQQLVDGCAAIEDWDNLLHQAEFHGLAPLLHKHLNPLAKESEIPADFMRGLKFLHLRHQQANKILLSSLRDILSFLEASGIRCLVLKGAALSQTLYSESGYRPMRDIDLLLDINDVFRAHELLQDKGYDNSNEELPDGYYHLPPLLKKVDGMQVCVELHHRLFPDDPPYYEQLDFDSLYQNRMEMSVDGITVATFANEEMLWHLYQHGFHAPLTYERFRLISLADIVSLVEDRVDEIDWVKISDRYPNLLNALSLFHHLTPWSEKVLSRRVISGVTAPSGVGEHYVGWPSQSSRSLSVSLKNIGSIMRSTIFPSQWWSMLYYAHKGNVWSTMRCGLVTHPMHIIRWVKVYAVRRGKNKI